MVSQILYIFLDNSWNKINNLLEFKFSSYRGFSHDEIADRRWDVHGD